MTSPARGGPDTAGAAREQVARWLSGKIDRPFMWDRSDDAYRAMWLAEADELLSLPAVQLLAVEKAAEVVEALRPHIPPSTDPNRRTAVIVRSTLNRAARAVRAAALAQPAPDQTPPTQPPTADAPAPDPTSGTPTSAERHAHSSQQKP